MSRYPVQYNVKTRQFEIHTQRGWVPIDITPPNTGGTSDHSELDNLTWGASGHIASGSSLAAFNSAMQTTLLSYADTTAIDTISPLESKGDLLGFDGTNHQKLSVGSNGQVLTVSSSSPTGLAWITPTVASGSGIADGDYGDVTVSSTGTVWTIDAQAITYAKIQNASAFSVIGRASNSSGVVAAITASGADEVLRTSGVTLGFGSIPESSVTNLVSDLASKIPSTVLTTKGDLLGYSTGTAAVAVGANGTLLMADSSASLGVSYFNPTHPGFGDRASGSITYTGNTTLTSPVNATNIVVNSGVRVNTAGYIIRCESLIFADSSSIISANGGNGAGASLGAGFTGNQLGNGAGGGAGFAGASAGNAGSARTNSWGPMSSTVANASDGGNGGADAGAAHAGGTGGDATPVGISLRSAGIGTYDMGLVVSTTNTVLQGGAGGGAGGGAAGATSGAGGGGGGVVIVWAKSVSGAGIIEANGGNGGNAAAPSGSAGGGGGGGGGAAVLVAHYVGSPAPTVRASGGSGGSGAGGGASGSPGKDGFAETRII